MMVSLCPYSTPARTASADLTAHPLRPGAGDHREAAPTTPGHSIDQAEHRLHSGEAHHAGRRALRTRRSAHRTRTGPTTGQVINRTSGPRRPRAVQNTSYLGHSTQGNPLHVPARRAIRQVGGHPVPGGRPPCSGPQGRRAAVAHTACQTPVLSLIHWRSVLPLLS